MVVSILIAYYFNRLNKGGIYMSHHPYVTIPIKTMIDTSRIYMCPNCFDTFRVDAQTFAPDKILVDERLADTTIYLHQEYMITCPNCNNVDLVPIDSRIAENIVALNKMGLYTEFCCEGHWKDESEALVPHGTDWYIKFKPLSDKDEIFIMKELNALRKKFNCNMISEICIDDYIDNSLIISCFGRLLYSRMTIDYDIHDVAKMENMQYAFNHDAWAAYHDESLNQLNELIKLMKADRKDDSYESK